MAYEPYTYLVCDLESNVVLGELPLNEVTFSTVLNDVGTLSGYILMTDPVAQARNIPALTQPGRTALYVDRGGVIIWGGIIWQRTYAVGAQMGQAYTLQVTADEFPSYYKQRILGSNKTYTNRDQLFIATDLINWANQFGSIGVYVPPAGSSGVLLTETYTGTDYKTFWSLVTGIATMSQGFDAMIDVGYGIGGQAPGVPGKQLTLSYPRRGRRAPDNGLVLDFPGNVAQYQWAEDGTQMANQIFDTGPSSGSTVMASVASNSAALTAGYPLLEATHSYTDSYVTQAILDSHAQADVKAYAYGVTTATVILQPDAQPIIGSYIVGDDLQLNIEDFRFPSGMSTTLRITRIDWTPQYQSMPEQVKLTLGPVPS